MFNVLLSPIRKSLKRSIERGLARMDAEKAGKIREYLIPRSPAAIPDVLYPLRPIKISPAQTD